MNATNLPVEAALDSAYLEAAKALMMIRHAQKGPKDADLYGCTLHFVGVALKHMMADMDAAGAQPMDDEDHPAYRRSGYVERLYELHDMRKSA